MNHFETMCYGQEMVDFLGWIVLSLVFLIVALVVGFALHTSWMDDK